MMKNTKKNDAWIKIEKNREIKIEAFQKISSGSKQQVVESYTTW